MFALVVDQDVELGIVVVEGVGHRDFLLPGRVRGWGNLGVASARFAGAVGPSSAAVEYARSSGGGRGGTAGWNPATMRAGDRMPGLPDRDGPTPAPLLRHAGRSTGHANSAQVRALSDAAHASVPRR